jgi:hypothetical protein
MWALSGDKQTVRLTVPALSPGDPLGSALRVEFDRASLEATLSMLVRMHFEMTRTAPAEIPSVKH